MNRIDGAGRKVLAGALGLIAIAALSGCAEIDQVTHLTPLSVDPASPVAADVEKAELTNGPIPSFRSIPPKPTDVPTGAQYKGRVLDVIGDRRALHQWEATHPAGVSDTEGFAESQRRLLAAQTPVAPDQEAQSEAFARKKANEATAPQEKARKKPAPVATSPY
jgi:hypothetical protein